MARTKAVAKSETPGFLTDDDSARRGDGVGRGNETVTAEDITIPRVDVLQDLSPQVKKNKAEYIEGAEPGLVYNTITGRLYGDTIFVIPVYFRKEYVIWKDRDSGGGFRGAHPTMTEANAAINMLDDGDACEAIETAQHFVLVVTPGDNGEYEVEEAVISMSRSKLSPSRKWNSLIRMRGGDRWTSVYRLAAVEAQNAAGQDYYNWHPKVAGNTNLQLCEVAESMYEAIKAGAKDVDRSTESGARGQEEVTDDDEM